MGEHRVRSTSRHGEVCRRDEVWAALCKPLYMLAMWLSRKILAAKPGDPTLSLWDPHGRRVFPCREQVLLWPPSPSVNKIQLKQQFY